MGRHVRFCVVVVVSALIITSCGGSENTSPPLADHGVTELDADGCEIVEKAAAVALELGVVQETALDADDHVLCPVVYETTPPMSGDHFPAWQNCGFYTEPLRDEVAVHSLEHGAVWIAFDPELDVNERDAISAFVFTDPHLLAAPYPGLANPIVLTAWQRQVAVERISDAAVGEFLDDQLGRRSTTAPEAGASCGGAIGSPPFEPLARYEETLAQFG